MKKLAIVLSVCFILLFCFGCSSDLSDNTQTTVRTHDGQLVSVEEFANFTDLGGSLVYDSATRIVYFRNDTRGTYSVYVPYYASNGLPYKYNVETNTLEEVN